VSFGTELAVFVLSTAAGGIGALAGVGGGIVVVPLLTIAFGIDIHLAIAASIISVIATSSGAAAAYVRDRLTDLRVAMFLELATTTGAVIGALLAAVAQPALLLVLLGIILLGSALQQVLRRSPRRSRRLLLLNKYQPPLLFRLSRCAGAIGHEVRSDGPLSSSCERRPC